MEASLAQYTPYKTYLQESDYLISLRDKVISFFLWIDPLYKIIYYKYIRRKYEKVIYTYFNPIYFF